MQKKIYLIMLFLEFASIATPPVFYEKVQTCVEDRFKNNIDTESFSYVFIKKTREFFKKGGKFLWYGLKKTGEIGKEILVIIQSPDIKELAEDLENFNNCW